MKKIIILIMLCFLLFSCNKEDTSIVKEISNTKVENKINITTSIVPIASITNYIGGDFVKVDTIVPAGVSPHGFDLKPNQMVGISKSDLIVYLGLKHIDGFLDKAIENKNVLTVLSGIELIEGSEHEDEEYGHEEEHHESDPHIWTSGKNALIIAEKIQNELIKLSPKNSDYFINNFVSFSSEINNIKNNFITKKEGKQEKKFMVFHDAYNYLFKELELNENNKLVFQKSVLSDPGSIEMKEIIDKIKTHGVNTVFREPQFKDSNLQKLVDEYSLKVFILDPLGNDVSKDGYISNYKNNLVNLENIYE